MTPEAIEAAFKNIRSLQQTLSAKDADVALTYKGYAYGVSKPFHIRVGDRETTHETFEGALVSLTSILKKELADKVASTEGEAKRLRQVLSQMGN
jgi:hypothetical protein